MMGTIRTVGLISDTHGLLRPEAVRGNIDTGAWSDALPETAVAEVGPELVYVLHDIDKLDIKAPAAGIAMVVSGHSHKPSCAEREGAIYVNPGSAGPRRFDLPVTVARVDLRQKPWKVEFIELVPARHEK